jgi:hypothetical protein
MKFASGITQTIESIGIRECGEIVNSSWSHSSKQSQYNTSDILVSNSYVKSDSMGDLHLFALLFNLFNFLNLKKY